MLVEIPREPGRVELKDDTGKAVALEFSREALEAIAVFTGQDAFPETSVIFRADKSGTPCGFIEPGRIITTNFGRKGFVTVRERAKGGADAD